MNPRLVFLLSITVIVFTAIGTLSHELGHAAVARYYGRTPRIHFGSTSSTATPEDSLFQDIALRNHAEIRAGKAFSERARFEALKRRIFTGQRNIIWGGPAQTMLTGTIGLALVLHRWRHFRSAGRLSAGQWLIVFLTLFWLRQVLNGVLSVAAFVITGTYAATLDEVRLAMYYGLPVWSIGFVTAMLAALVCVIVICAIPKRQRTALLVAFIAGAPAGYVIWFRVLGPLWLP